MADVVVERDEKSSAGPIVAVVAVVLLVLAALWVLPSLLGGGNTNSPTPTDTSAPAAGQ